MYKENNDIIKKSFSFSPLEQYFSGKEQPISLGLIDQMLVIQFQPNTLEAFQVNKSTNTVSKTDMHQTLTLNSELPETENAIMPLQFSFSDYFHSFFAQKYKNGQWETYEFEIKKSGFDYDTYEYKNKMI